MKILSLQGLRGIAATVVLLSHPLELFYLSGVGFGEIATVMNPIAHVFGILAAKAVWLFFVLSGFVLQMQFAKSAFSVRSLILSRFVRLYIPAAAALALAVTLFRILPPESSASYWIGINPLLLSDWALITQFTLFTFSFTLGPLWSITWEIIYSIAILPLIFRVRFKYPLVALFTFVLISGIGRYIENGWLQYIPMFLVGFVLHDLIFGSRANNYSRGKKPGFLEGVVLSAVLIINYLLGKSNQWEDELIFAIDVAVTLLLVVVIISMSLQENLVSKVSSHWVPVLLGKFSYSLYVLHASLILTAFHATGFSHLAVSLTTVAALPLSYLFWLLIEKPSQTLSSRLRALS